MEPAVAHGKAPVRGPAPQGAPPQHLADDDLNVRVNEIATKEIRYGAMALIAVATGVIAAQGLIVATIMTAAVVLTVFAIEANAERSFLDMDNPLATAAKVQTLAEAYFWSHAIFASTLVGLTGALAFSGSVAMAVDDLLLKGLALHLLAWLGLLPPTQNMITDIARFGNDITPFKEKLTFLSESLQAAKQEGQLNPTLPAFLLGQYLKTDLTADGLFAELQPHQQANGIKLEDYFAFLVPLLSSSTIEEFVKRGPDVITWPFLIAHLSEQALESYTGAKETLESIEKLTGGDNAENEPFAHLFDMASTLQTLMNRLKTLPDGQAGNEEDSFVELQQKRDRITELRKQTIEVTTASGTAILTKLGQMRMALQSPDLTAANITEMQQELAKRLVQLDNLPAQVDADLTVWLDGLRKTPDTIREVQAELKQYRPKSPEQDAELV